MGRSLEKTRPGLLQLLLFISCVLGQGCIAIPEEQQGDTVKIGALLPFTGDLAASGANIERALIWVVEQINESGGVAGRQIQLITQDTNSAVKQGMKSARKLIEEKGVIGIIGPEYEDLAKEMMPLITKHKVVQISGGVTSTIFSTLDTANLWFRTFPSALSLGSVLAEQIYKQGWRKIVILRVMDEYGQSFSKMVCAEFVARGGQCLQQVPFLPNRQSYRDEINRAIALLPEAIVLVAYPKTGATIIKDWVNLGSSLKLFFSHALFNDEFVKNVPPGSIEGMLGVTTAPTRDAEVFSYAYSERWPGDQPLAAANFYYDAMAIMALAIEAAAVKSKSGEIPGAEEISPQIITVSTNPKGRTVAWNELAYGLDLVRSSTQYGTDYIGASGFLDLDANGEVTTGLVQLWTVEGGRIVKGETVTSSPLGK